MNKKILALSLLAFSIHSSADSLLDIYNDALENDPQYRSAEFSYLSGKEIKVQGRAALLPSISISAQTNWNEYYQNGNLQNQYNNFSTSARLTQPLIRLDTWFKYRQSKFLTDAAEADFAYSQQSLIVRTAELYFNVLRAIDNLSAARSEEKAIKKQLDQIRQRYEVGLAAVTEVQEAQLAFDLSVASRTRTEGEVYTAKESLNALVGREIVSLDGLVNDLNVTNPVPASKEEWARKAVENNFRLQAANLRKFASKNNARSVASNHLPKVDIVGAQTESETNQYAYDGLNTGGAFNITVPDETQRDTYSLQLSMPIFQGGAVISRTKQAYAESNKSSEEALFDFVVENGSEDLDSNEDEHIIFCDQSDLHNLNEKIISNFGQTNSSELVWKSDVNIEVNKETAEKLFKLLNALEDNEDVQGVSSNFEVSEKIPASLT